MVKAYVRIVIGGDGPIWHHQWYTPHPRLNDKDGPIGAFRRWADQFYATAAPGTRHPAPGKRTVRIQPQDKKDQAIESSRARPGRPDPEP